MMKTDLISPYLPMPARVEEVIVENSQIKTFVLTLNKRGKVFPYKPGQFAMVSIPHCGEAPISFSSSPTERDVLRVSVRRAGSLTSAMHGLQKGANIGLRGPYGRPFPIEHLKGQDLLFVAGGIGMAPLRSVIMNCLAERENFGRITVLYGCRTPDDIAFQQELDSWQKQKNVSCVVTVDVGSRRWKGPVGVVTTLFDTLDITPDRSVAMVCGPSAMIRFSLAGLSRLGFSDDRIVTTLERHMKCGIGVCRHCHMGSTLVCTDGPVFTLKELRGLDVMELSA